MASLSYRKSSKNSSHNWLDLKEIHTYQELEVILKQYIKSKKELKNIEFAYNYANDKHKEQLRKNGDPYIYHCLTTASYLAQWRMGPKTIIAGLLHDIFEDTPVKKEELIDLFGNEVYELVESVTKVSFFAKEKREQLKSDYLRKLYLSMAKDVRVIIIKMADRMHNMVTISNLSEDKQKVIAKETLEIYSTIAHRLGMKNAKSNLEDMAFQVLEPDKYDEIIQLINVDQEKRTKAIEKIITDLQVYLRKEKNIKIIDIFGRPKTVHSIYRKMNWIGKNFDEITDILAVRIIAKSVDDCYKILGFIHQKYVPIRGKFKDYIAMPKNGVYKSLHTTLIDEKGNIFEVQIRTEEMDDISETGVAAHWRYKEGNKTDIAAKQAEIDEQINVFNEIINWDKESALTDENDVHHSRKKETVEEHLKKEIFTQSIYVLTPTGNVVTLPYGATVLDFAYRIHTEVGEKTTGAKINGVFAPINTVLKSGQVVEIKTSTKQQPTPEWLKIVATSNAKNRIRKYLSQKNSEESIKDKKDENKLLIKKTEATINSYINQKDLRWKKNNEEEILEKVKHLGFKDLNEFLLIVARGDYSITEAVNLVFVNNKMTKDDEALSHIKSKVVHLADNKNDILVDGITNIKTSIASCCMPVPTEPSIGYVTKGTGIKVHLIECPNITDALDKNRLVSIQWNTASANKNSYITKIKFYADDRPNLLYDVTRVLTGLKASTINASINVDPKSLLANAEVTIKISNSNQLYQIISSIKSIPNVIDVERGIKRSKNKI